MTLSVCDSWNGKDNGFLLETGMYGDDLKSR